MSFDFSKLRSTRRGVTEVDPIKLFGSLQMSDEGVNDLWMGQGDALREWHGNRSCDDIAVVLNTGAGKTLVGLLMAQSLVNETAEPVVYVCASIQLVQQTAAKAASYGLPVTTYFGSTFSDTLFQEGLAPCLTTYQALFNGLTHKWDNAKAFIFDDAHAATHIVRDQFTLHLQQAAYPGVFAVIQAAFDEHLQATDSALGFREALATKDQRSWFVPPFVLKRTAGTLNDALVAAKLSSDSNHRYVWGYLKDKIDLCAVFMTASGVYFTPPVVPIRNLPYFKAGLRRIYLSATLAAQDAFLRTFGRSPDITIAPPTPAGQCERMILVPAKTTSLNCDDVQVAKSLIQNAKALVMVPSRREGRAWEDITPEVLGDQVAEQVEQFKQAAAPSKLRLVARYDGVDLPGDTCRVMVIHGLPAGLGPLERFMWDTLRIHSVLRTTVASRIVQSFGRISRGMADHGVVVLTGKRLIEWLLMPANRGVLPPFLRSQIEAGVELSSQVGADGLAGLAAQCIARDEGWRNWHSQAVGSASTGPEIVDQALSSVAKAESEFGLLLWSRDYKEAAAVLYQNRDAFFRQGTGLGAWYRMWEGYIHDLMGEHDEATNLYRDARKADKAIPCAANGSEPIPDIVDAQQVQEVARYLLGNSHVISRLDMETASLTGGTVPETEEAVRCLGTYLGLCSSRPDNDEGTGPDVVWYLPGCAAWSMELKTGKTTGLSYSKKNVMQAMDHVQWIRDNLDVTQIYPFIVGAHLPPHAQANPPTELRVQTPIEILDLRRRLRATIENVLSSHTPVTLRADVLREFGKQGLLWSQLSACNPGVVLRDVTAAMS